WIMFNFDGGIQRAYDMFLSLLCIYFFVLHLKFHGKWIFLPITGFLLGANLLMFHMGSFLVPLIISLYSITISILEKNLNQLRYVFFIFCIAGITFLLIDFTHLKYFNLQESVFFSWINHYFGPELSPHSSHDPKNLLIFNLEKIIDNTGFFFNSIFFNGIDQDGHYVIAPPEIPLIYNYFIFLFSLPGILILYYRRKREDIFVLVWVLLFLVVYTLVVQVRVKNFYLLIPPFLFLAAQGIQLSNKYLSWPFIPSPLMSLIALKTTRFIKNWHKYFLEITLVGSSCALGS
ncbi:uncharacterized protein METZ01_LOCUS391550, partial [marine metagenome]